MRKLAGLDGFLDGVEARQASHFALHAQLEARAAATEHFLKHLRVASSDALCSAGGQGDMAPDAMDGIDFLTVVDKAGGLNNLLDLALASDNHFSLHAVQYTSTHEKLGDALLIKVVACIDSHQATQLHGVCNVFD